VSAEKRALRVSDLHVDLTRPGGSVAVLKGISLAVDAGAALGLVGESGSGKSVACRAILDLLPRGMAVTSGGMAFRGQDLRGLTKAQFERLRGDRIALIPQDPLTALDPVLRIRDQVAEALTVHSKVGKREARERAVELLSSAGIPDPRQQSMSYPHELSGGMRQRVLIAMAIANEPDLLLADEPTTSLDVTVQHQILKLLAELQEKVGMSLVLVTHNFSVVAGICDWIAVMYSGYVLEYGRTHDVLREPLHPYTQALLAAMPVIEDSDLDRHLYGIPGSQPALGDQTPGCVFAPRCPYSVADCVRVDMSMVETAPAHTTACPVRLT
jgi:oligopeptide/dipeptide ABC transporter ATP-binding protein